MAIAATNYNSYDGAATEYLKVLEDAPKEEQKGLFQMVISFHDVLEQKENPDKAETSLSQEEWIKIVRRITEMVEGWGKTALRNNASPNETASVLWDQLQTLEKGNDRIVGLSILLYFGAVPYGQLPGNLTLVEPTDVCEEARDRAIDKITTLRRVKNTPKISSRELAVAITELLDDTKDKNERAAILFDFLSEISKDMHDRVYLASLSGPLLDGLRRAKMVLQIFNDFPFYLASSADEEAENTDDGN